VLDASPPSRRSNHDAPPMISGDGGDGVLSFNRRATQVPTSMRRRVSQARIEPQSFSRQRSLADEGQESMAELPTRASVVTVTAAFMSPMRRSFELSSGMNTGDQAASMTEVLVDRRTSSKPTLATSIEREGEKEESGYDWTESGSSSPLLAVKEVAAAPAMSPTKAALELLKYRLAGGELYVPRRNSASRSSEDDDCVSRHSGASSFCSTTRAKSEADDDMPMPPWCGQCQPLRPTDELPLHPFDLSVLSMERCLGCNTQDAENAVRRRALGCHQLTMMGENSITSINDAYLGPKPSQSRFSSKPMISQDEDVPAVLKKLPYDAIGMLEVFCVNHLRKYCVIIAAAAHSDAPGSSNRLKSKLAMSTVCTLLQRLKKRPLKIQEYAFVKMNIVQCPVFCDMPEDILEWALRKLTVKSYLRGAEMLTQGDDARGILVLVQGEVELVNEQSSRYQNSVWKDSPCALCDGILKSDRRYNPTYSREESQKERLFLMLAPEDRVWSRTVKASDSIDAVDLCLTIWLPLEIITRCSDYFRNIECKERLHLVAGMFAAATRLPPQTCAKRCDLFEVEDFERAHMLFQEGCVPKYGNSKLYVVIEGQVRLVKGARQQRRKRAGKTILSDPGDFRGPGKLFGDACIYGEAYSHSAVVLSTTAKVLTIGARDYVEKLLHKTFPMQRHKDEDRSRQRDLQAELLDGDDVTSLSDQHAEAAEDAKRYVQRTPGELLRRIRDEEHASQDLQAVYANHWKALKPKADLPRRRLPKEKCRRLGPLDPSGRMDEAELAERLNFPTEADLFPSVKRSLLAAQATPVVGSLSASLPTALPSTASQQSSARGLLSGGRRMLSSIEHRIHRVRETMMPLEPEFNSHALSGHIEDAYDRRYVLSKFGTMKPRSRPHTSPAAPHVLKA